MNATTTRSTRSNQGFALIHLSILLPVLLGMVALVMDLGVSITTRRMMDTAVQAGALEGLRQRDSGLPEDQQRLNVRQIMQESFDDNLNPGDGDTLRLGAGPVIPFTSAGRTNANALQTVDVANLSVYDPVPQLNTLASGNNRHYGDMVSGTYDAAQRHDEGYNPDPYLRNDFSAYNGGGPNPDSFLVRMRRTRFYASAGSQDDQANISSAGPPIPFLLGRGSMMKAADASLGYSPRAHGMTVRATAIANAQRSLCVGKATVGTIDGLAPFALERNFWDAMNVGVGITVSIDGAGQISETSGTPLTPAARDGQIVNQAAPLATGDPLPALAFSALPAANEVYIPIFENLGGGAGERIIGFARATLATAGLDYTVTKLAGIVAPKNASANLCKPFSATMPQAQIAALFSARAAFSEPLQSPALVRSYSK